MDNLQKIIIYAAIESKMVKDRRNDLLFQSATNAYGVVTGGKFNVIRKYSDEYGKLKKEYGKNVLSIVDRVKAGKLSPTDGAAEFSLLAQNHFKKAFQYGALFSGNPFVDKEALLPNDDHFLTAAANYESGFFKNFMKDVDKLPDGDIGKMLYSQRAEMYEKSLDGMFNSGYMTAFPEETSISWMLGITDQHCPDCVNLAAGSPYTRATLPFSPRSGHTRCFLDPTTPVYTISGWKEIQDIQIGEQVLTHKNRFRRVIEHSRNWTSEQRKYTEPSYKVIVKVGDSVIELPPCVKDHKYLTFGKKWVEAQNLATGMLLTAFDDSQPDSFFPAKITHIKIRISNKAEKWSIGVKEDESYISSGIVSHNCLSHCKCWLRINSAEPTQQLITQADVPTRPSQPSVPISEDYHIRFDDLFARMNFHRQKAYIYKDDKTLRDFHLAQRKAYNQQIIALQNELDISVRPTFAVRDDLLKAVDDHLKAGNVPVENPISVLNTLDEVSILEGSILDFGIVKDIKQATISLDLAIAGEKVVDPTKTLFFRKQQERVFDDAEKAAIKLYDLTEEELSNYKEFMKLDSESAKEMLKYRKVSKPEVYEKIKEARENIVNSTTSYDIHFNKETGSFDKERKLLHEKIARDFVNGGKVAEDKAEFLMTGGYPGSGKSTMLDTAFDDWRGKYVHIDSDEIKVRLAKADGIDELGWRAAQYHYESDFVIDLIRKYAIEENRNILFDGTMKSTKKMLKMIGEFKDSGYGVKVAFADLPLQKTIERAIARFIGPTGRFVDPAYIVTHGDKNLKTLEAVKKLVDSWVHYSTDVARGEKPRLIGKGSK